jgi:hypothetical protein
MEAEKTRPKNNGFKNLRPCAAGVEASIAD